MYIPPKINQILSEFDLTSWINRPLTKRDTDLLCEQLNLPSYNPYECCKWQTVKLYLKEFGYIINDDRTYINGIRTRVSIINNYII